MIPMSRDKNTLVYVALKLGVKNKLAGCYGISRPRYKQIITIVLMLLINEKSMSLLKHNFRSRPRSSYIDYYTQPFIFKEWGAVEHPSSPPSYATAASTGYCHP